MASSEIAKIKQELDDLKSELSAQISKYSSNNNSSIVADYEAKISKITSDYESQITKLTNDHSMVIESLNSQHNNIINSLRSQLQSQQDTHSKELSDQAKTYQIEKDGIVFTNTSTVSSLQKQVDDLTLSVAKLKKSEFNKDTEIVRLLNSRSVKSS